MKGRIYKLTYTSKRKKVNEYYTNKMQAQRSADSLNVKYLIEPIEINASSIDCSWDADLMRANMFNVKLLRVIK